jgi:uncharacterized protein YegL
MVIFSMVIVIGGSLMKFANTSFDISSRESAVQSNVRVAAETINSKVKNSTALFLIPRSSFESGRLTAGWDYIGVVNREKNGQQYSQIVHFVYNAATDSHVQEVLAETVVGTTYGLQFSTKNVFEQNKLVQYQIKGYYGEDTPNPSMDLNSEIEALNSLQIIDYSSEYDVATAIAFKGDNREMGKEGVTANITLILDCSDSMNGNLANYTTSILNTTRTYALREAAQKLMNQFAAVKNYSNMSIVGFHDYAYYAYPPGYPEEEKLSSNFIRLKDYYDMIFEMFDPAVYKGRNTSTALDPILPQKCTNTGDGLRVAYNSIVKQSDKLQKEGIPTKDYMILMIDGDVNEYLYQGNTSNMYYGDKTYQELPSLGVGYSWSTPSIKYLTDNAARFKANPNIEVYFIVFSASASESQLTMIKESLGIPEERYFKATDFTELGQVFEGVGRTIAQDLWFINGPGL